MRKLIRISWKKFTPSTSTVTKWAAEFKHECTFLKDEEGQTTTATTKAIEKVHNIVLDNGQVKANGEYS